jgi:FAD:protein FMN transferase
MDSLIRLQQSKHALGSEALLTLVGPSEQALEELFTSLWQEIQLFEQTFSRFISDSELSQVNGRAGLPTTVSPEFIRLAAAAQDLSKRTNGLYDPFVLPALQSAGYKGSWPAPDKFEAELDYSTRAVARATDMLLTAETVQLPPNSALDFGGIGKGYLLDSLAEILEHASCGNFWLSLGGDIIARGQDADGTAWEIGIAAAEAASEVVTASPEAGKAMAVATSGTTKRRGPGWHHIIDPRTGKPARTDVLTATACSSSATEADVFAKCLVLLGSAEVPGFAQKHHIAKWLLQIQDVSGKIKVVKQGL